MTVSDVDLGRLLENPEGRDRVVTGRIIVEVTDRGENGGPATVRLYEVSARKIGDVRVPQEIASDGGKLVSLGSCAGHGKRLIGREPEEVVEIIHREEKG